MKFRIGWRRVQSFLSTLLTLIVLVSLPTSARATQQYQGVCAQVKIEILQELTLERIGFLATLEVTNNEGDGNITNFSAELTFEDFFEDEGGGFADASQVFFVQPPELEGVNAIDGSGIILPGETAVVRWFIIPKIAAGGQTPEGLRYNIGANLAASIYGQEIAPDTLEVIPDTITVKPEPQLEITYFQPRDVDGDNPFTTDVVEAPIPFTLGVLVNNAGQGPANDVKIASEQPQIVDNLRALVLVAQLLGVRVDDEPTDQTSLTMDLGDIQPGNCRKGAWDMITTLSGEFIEFQASYTHASELGGRDTSIIRDLNAYFIVHEVKNDQPGRDGLTDFLADTTDDESLVPDTLYETDCTTSPVNVLTQHQLVDYNALVATIDVTADFENWVYFQLDDPGQAKFEIDSVVRSDGKVLDENNYWTNVRYRKTDNAKLTYLNIFDLVALGDYTYTVTYAAPQAETDPPETFLRFDGDVELVGSRFYVGPDTRMFFTAEDVSPVEIFYKFAEDPEFLPALPFYISQPGDRVIEFYSVDEFGNEEMHQFATLVLDSSPPSVQNLNIDTSEIFFTGDSISVRSDQAVVSFDVGSSPTTINARIEVYEGVYGFPSLDGVPSTPTTQTGANITVGGVNVDFYRYRLNGAAWSAEAPVAQPIALAGLGGTVSLEVSGRSQYGGYGPDGEAVGASWTVSAGAAPIAVAGPATPTRATNASVFVAGPDFFCYRADGSFYQREPAGGAPIVLSELDEGTHLVEVLARAGGDSPCPGDVPGASYSWLVDRSYGTALPAAMLVRSQEFLDVGGARVYFAWSGVDEGGKRVRPGWYTVKITLTDSLSRATSELALVRVVGDLLDDGVTMPGVSGAAQRHAHARGSWMVWQDQRSGDWDIYARDLRDPGATPFVVTTTAANQERPHTDGEYVVWEDRQADGSWDIWIWKLGSAETPFAVTATPDLDEQRPAVDWPWVVFQQRPVANPAASWQVAAVNLSTFDRVLVDPTSTDQLDPKVHAGRAVWQDMRNVGAGDIFVAELATSAVLRITDDPAGQIQPSIFDHWVVWADNRAGLQLDLYGYNLKRGVEIQLTNTPQDEARPFAADRWVVYTDDSANAPNVNLKLLYLPSQASVQLTNFESEKAKPAFASGRLVWTDKRNGAERVMLGDVPDLQPVFDNTSTVVVTEDMAVLRGSAFALLSQWNGEIGVTEISRYTSLLPAPVAETATWSGTATGDDFPLVAGEFLWVEFDSSEILDLGNQTCGPVDLAVGVTALSYTCFPDHYSAYQVVRELGLANVGAIRALDSSTGRWSVATVSDGSLVGEDFAIPRVAVIMLDLIAPQTQWTPGEGVAP